MIIVNKEIFISIKYLNKVNILLFVRIIVSEFFNTKLLNTFEGVKSRLSFDIEILYNYILHNNFSYISAK